jgi:hypothetical protein
MRTPESANQRHAKLCIVISRPTIRKMVESRPQGRVFFNHVAGQKTYSGKPDGSAAGSATIRKTNRREI